jgi:ribosomal 50S subunit-recycling heat shock protein
VRLDKFLQVSRLVRRRALANSLCHAGRVTLNGRAVPPSAAVRPDDVITVEIADRLLRARVIAAPEGHRRSGDIQWVEMLEGGATE